MSTRRSTRASSQANSRGATPAIGVNDTPYTPAPRRAFRRAGNEPLPAVSLRPSTAYGSNTLPAPSRTTGPLVADQVQDVLKNLLAPNPNPPPVASSSKSPTATLRLPRSTAARSRSQTPAASSSLSFVDESNIFGTAAIDSSVVSTDDSPLLPDPVQQRLEAERVHIESIAKQRLQAAHTARGHRFPNAQVNLRATLQRIWSLMITGFPMLLYALLAFFAGMLLFTIGCKILNGMNSLRDFAPSPGSYFLPGEVVSIHDRLNVLESEVKNIKQHFSDLDPHSITRLKKLLPDQLIVKKDKKGILRLSDDFWQALQDKIRSDETLTPRSGPSSGNLLTESQAGKLWDKYIKKNKATLETYSLDQVSNAFPQLLRDNKIATKEEIISSIHRAWDEKKDEISKDMGDLRKKLNAASDSIKKFKHGSGDVSKQDIATAVEDVLRNIIPKAQLEALSQSRLGVMPSSISRINHFSKGTGATIHTKYTSPNYVLPDNDVWFLERLRRKVQRNDVPVPNAPEAALMPWQEHGDCWCTPSEDAKGGGPSLSVMMGNNIYPEQVVVEHITPSGSLEPGATPKDMELLAFVPNAEHFHALMGLSASIFPIEEGEYFPYGYIRIAQWTYDVHASNYIQAFDVGLDMKGVEIHTNKLIVRAKSNWGGEAVPYTCFYRIRVHGEAVASPQLY